jgi:hypothetical protein
MVFHVERDGDHRFRLFGELDLANADDLYRHPTPMICTASWNLPSEKMAVSAWIYPS